ncbi:sulfite exporter TauE/SafE family protein [Candidatus Uhrbacteria bacterium]|nr:sulfite exporter TauE/SafE family protein [Candidatus Uhrbacteria bacterium]
MSSPHVIKINVTDLGDAVRAEEFRAAASSLPGVTRVDVNGPKGLARIISDRPITASEVARVVAPRGFVVRAIPAADAAAPQSDARMPVSNVVKLEIEGMTCRSCEITVERKFKQVSGVKKVDVDASMGIARIVTDGRAPSLDEFQRALGETTYEIRGRAPTKRAATAESDRRGRPSFWQLVGLFGFVLLLGAIFSRLGLLRPSAGLGGSVSFVAAFVIGLVAASSSCLAVAGGLMLSTTARFRERVASLSPLGRMRPVFLFVAGRLLGYGVLGGLIGAIGSALSPSPFVTGLITIAAALFMLIMGLDMLHLAPAWLKRLLPRMPKALAHRVMDQEGKTHPAAPLMLGAGTFFLPCGFTQALQLYALTTGSALTGASVLFAFALGTAPALLALGFASSSLKGRLGELFFRFSGALVIVLGLWNVQNGLAITGHPLELPRLSLPERAVAAEPAGGAADPYVTFDGKEQSVAIDVSYAGFSPERFTLRKGVPTTFNISGDAAGVGCLAVFQIPKLGVRQFLKSGDTTTVAFTPQNPGNYVFSCSMGMFRGNFEVL